MMSQRMERDEGKGRGAVEVEAGSDGMQSAVAGKV